MLYYGFRNCIIIIRKLKPSAILSLSPNTPLTFLSCSNLQTIVKTEFIKRDFHKHTNNYNVMKSKDEKDAIDNAELQELLKDNHNEKEYKIIKYEIEYMKQLNEPVPQNIRPKEWIQLITAPTRSQRRKYLKFLFINEIKDRNDKLKRKALKERLLQKWEEKQKLFTSGLTYGLNANNLFLRIYDKTMDHFYNYNLILSMLFEPKIVFDFGYEEHMSNIELNNCAKQLLFSFVINRMHHNPSHLYLCNAPKDSKLLQKLNVLIPNLCEDYFPMDITPKSYLDVFDKDNLVYLTPHCKAPMVSYNPNKIYVIGALVDKAEQKPYSLAKAKKEGLRMEKFPLDQYLYWSAGSGKSLTLNQVLSILLDMKVHKDWKSVLTKHVPPRKLTKLERR